MYIQFTFGWTKGKEKCTTCQVYRYSVEPQKVFGKDASYQGVLAQVGLEIAFQNIGFQGCLGLRAATAVAAAA